MGAAGELSRLDESALSDAAVALAREMRTLLAGLDVNMTRYAARVHRDKGDVSRYFSGRRIPAWEFVHNLLVDSTLHHRGEPPTDSVVAHLRQLHRAALESGGSPRHQIQLLQDRLADADSEVQRAVFRERELEQDLESARRRIADLEVRQKELYAARDDDWQQLYSQISLHQNESTGERAALMAEITRLEGELKIAHKRREIAEARCRELEQQFDLAESKTETTDPKHEELLQRIEAERVRASKLEKRLQEYQGQTVFGAGEKSELILPEQLSLPLADAMEKALDEIEGYSNRVGDLTGISTGFTDLDLLTNGLQPGDLVVIGGRPGIGKSIFARDLLRACSIRNRLASALFTFESTREQVITCLLSAEARVALHHIKAGRMTDDDWARLARTMGTVSSAPLFITDAQNMSLAAIKSQCTLLSEKYDLRLIAIDTIGSVTHSTQAHDKSEVTDVCSGLRAMAKEFGIVVVAITQLSRPAETRRDKWPLLDDLTFSNLDEVADVVILLHREDTYERHSPRSGEADLIVAKHRQGPTATITVAFQGHYSRFVDLASTPAPSDPAVE